VIKMVMCAKSSNDYCPDRDGMLGCKKYKSSYEASIYCTYVPLEKRVEEIIEKRLKELK
jgi:hypothetical protein